MKKIIHLIAAARPNFMKIAPIYHVLKKENWADPRIIHTGQHYDVNMSDAFFADLNMPEPHLHLNVGSGTHAEQTGKVMIAYEKILLAEKPDLVVVVGDVNSTMACTIAAVKISYPPNHEPRASSYPYGRRPFVAHLEAGLRSFDRTMPEEINRIVTDSGGIQEETTYLGIPCFTLRNNTERPITITQGTNRLCKAENLLAEVKKYFDGGGRKISIPEMWDGKTAQRVAQSIQSFFVYQA